MKLPFLILPASGHQISDQAEGEGQAFLPVSHLQGCDFVVLKFSAHSSLPTTSFQGTLELLLPLSGLTAARNRFRISLPGMNKKGHLGI